MPSLLLLSVNIPSTTLLSRGEHKLCMPVKGITNVLGGQTRSIALEYLDVCLQSDGAEGQGVYCGWFPASLRIMSVALRLGCCAVICWPGNRKTSGQPNAFAKLSHTRRLKIIILEATLPGDWGYRVSAWTGWSGVRML